MKYEYKREFVVLDDKDSETDVLNSFGVRGWELVFVLPVGCKGTVFYFKKTC